VNRAGELSLSIERTAPEGFVALAGRTRFVRGAARYRRADLGAQLARFAAPSFVVARRADAVLGGCVLDRRRLSLGGQPVQGLYRALLGVHPECRGQGVGRAVVGAAFAEADRLAAQQGLPVLSYGCVDRTNAASLALLRSRGARARGQLAPALIYRQWPRSRLSLQRAEPSARRACDALIAASEADCSLRDVSDSHAPGWCWQDARGPAIVADAAVSTLSFDTLGPLNDRWVAALVSPFGFARRRFDPAAFRYLRLSSVGVRVGAEGRWTAFLDSLLRSHDCHYAMLVIDPGRSLAARLRLARSAGTLQLMSRWHGSMPPAEPAPGPIAVHPVDI